MIYNPEIPISCPVALRLEYSIIYESLLRLELLAVIIRNLTYS
jgi:hypothetical protein